MSRRDLRSVLFHLSVLVHHAGQLVALVSLERKGRLDDWVIRRTALPAEVGSTLQVAESRRVDVDKATAEADNRVLATLRATHDVRVGRIDDRVGRDAEDIQRCEDHMGHDRTSLRRFLGRLCASADSLDSETAFASSLG